MLNTRKLVVAACLFVLISCGNFSKLCHHGNGWANQFGGASIDAPSNPMADPALWAKPAGEVVVITWKQLADISFEKRWSKEMEMDFFFPVFGKELKKLDKREIKIAGYMIPISVKDGVYALSRYTFSACFFCGKSGPESVIALKFKNKPGRFKTDEFHTLRGTLELNGTNVKEFILILHGAELADDE
jgi:hypothetical protein